VPLHQQQITGPHSSPEQPSNVGRVLTAAVGDIGGSPRVPLGDLDYPCDRVLWPALLVARTLLPVERVSGGG
jgi:hypothetical protein